MRVDFEISRVAAAFQVEVQDVWQEGLITYCLAVLDGVEIRWQIDHQTSLVSLISIGKEGAESQVIRLPDPIGWNFFGNSRRDGHRAVLARGLYRLGIEDANLLSQLNYPLTAHERLELRLSIPRELWPSQWLTEATEVAIGVPMTREISPNSTLGNSCKRQEKES